MTRLRRSCPQGIVCLTLSPILAPPFRADNLLRRHSTSELSRTRNKIKPQACDSRSTCLFRITNFYQMI